MGKGEWIPGGLEEHKMSRQSTWDSHGRDTILSGARMVDSGCTFRKTSQKRECPHVSYAFGWRSHAKGGLSVQQRHQRDLVYGEKIAESIDRHLWERSASGLFHCELKASKIIISILCLSILILWVRMFYCMCVCMHPVCAWCLWWHKISWTQSYGWVWAVRKVTNPGSPARAASALQCWSCLNSPWKSMFKNREKHFSMSEHLL